MCILIGDTVDFPVIFILVTNIDDHGGATGRAHR
jgi:hypothetical protein